MNGDVSHTMPLLGSYYYLNGFYATYISSGSETSGSESSYITENESTTSERSSNSGNTNFQSLECMQHFTLMLNRFLLIQLLIYQIIKLQHQNSGIHHLPLHLPLNVLLHKSLMNVCLPMPIYYFTPLIQWNNHNLPTLSLCLKNAY